MEKHFECENHISISAVGICEVCGKPVCGDCATSHNGKIFCDESFHLKIYDEQQFFAEAETLFEIELVAKNLQANNVSCVWFNPKQFGTERLPKLYVAKASIADAQSILQSLDLLDFINNEVRRR